VARAAGPEIQDPFDRDALHQQKRRALLHAAAEMFNEHGYATASLEAVAHQLKISKAAVYYYFKNKQEILFECYEISFDIWEEALRSAHAEGNSGREKLEIYMRRYLDAGLDALQPLLVIREWSALQRPAREKIEARRKSLRNQVRDIIAGGVADGTLAPCDPKLAATIIGSSISWLLRMYRSDGGLAREDFVNQVLELLLNGLAGKAPARAQRSQGTPR
jgi:TetR/AcrR family transcriptional regulator